MDEAKSTFDRIAEDYDLVRPSYPDSLIEDIISFSKINAESKLLEVGAGTGQATQSFAIRGFNILAIEPGPTLSDVARRNTSQHPSTKILTTTFEDWNPEFVNFDLVYSATAFHFVDQSIGYQKLANVLTDHGSLALFWTVHVPGSSDLHQKIRLIYRRIAPHLEDSAKESPEEFIKDKDAAIRKDGFFQTPTIKKYQWTESYSAEKYVTLLNTHSGHQLLEPKVRSQLFSEIQEEIHLAGGNILKNHLVVLFLTHRQ